MIDRIRELSKKRGISLSFLCRKMEVATPYFLDIEKQHRSIPNEKLEIIAKTLFTSVEYLKGETDNVDDFIILDRNEKKLITDFRELSDQGQEYILQTMDLAVRTYKKDNSVSDMEKRKEII